MTRRIYVVTMILALTAGCSARFSGDTALQDPATDASDSLPEQVPQDSGANNPDTAALAVWGVTGTLLVVGNELQVAQSRLSVERRGADAPCVVNRAIASVIPLEPPDARVKLWWRVHLVASPPASEDCDWPGAQSFYIGLGVTDTAQQAAADRAGLDFGKSLGLWLGVHPSTAFLVGLASPEAASPDTGASADSGTSTTDTGTSDTGTSDTGTSDSAASLRWQAVSTGDSASPVADSGADTNTDTGTTDTGGSSSQPIDPNGMWHLHMLAGLPL